MTNTSPTTESPTATMAANRPNDPAAWAVAADIARRFQDGWNRNDGVAYTAPLAEDADYITIQGMHLTDRNDMAHGIGELYATVYANSTITIEVTSAMHRSPDVIVAQLHHLLSIPAGPLAGEVPTLATIVAQRIDDDWQVVALHNTVVAPPPDAAPSPDAPSA